MGSRYRGGRTGSTGRARGASSRRAGKSGRRAGGGGGGGAPLYKEGQDVKAQAKDSGKWYQAVITDVYGHDSYRVKFSDLGYSQTCSSKEIAALSASDLAKIRERRERKAREKAEKAKGGGSSGASGGAGGKDLGFYNSDDDDDELMELIY